MCLLESCLCCISLSVGLHFICFGYLILFSYLSLLDRTHSGGHHLNVIEWWIYGGLIASICGWIGLRWEKKFFVFILFVYDLCVAVGRAGLLYMYYNYPENMNLITREDVAKVHALILAWNLYVLWVELSYLQQDPQPTNTFHPVPQNVIITTEVRRGAYEPAPVAQVYPPNEYQRQLAYAVQPSIVSMPVPVCANPPSMPYPAQHPGYPPNYPHLYPTAADSMTVNASQPFPYDAPPPYSEMKQTSHSEIKQPPPSAPAP